MERMRERERERVQRAGRDPGIECTVREAKGEREEESNVKGENRMGKGDEERACRYGEVRMLHRVAALSLHCVPLRHSLVPAFHSTWSLSHEGQAVVAIAKRADSVLHLSFLVLHLPLSTHSNYRCNSRFINLSVILPVRLNFFTFS